MHRLLLLLLGVLAIPTQADEWLYLTYPGDTLIKIGQQYLKNPNDWPKVQQANHLADPRRLPSGTRIRLPVALLKVTPAPAVVTHKEGNVRIKPQDGVFRPLAVGDTIRGGETVLTGPGSFASFKLADGSLLSEQPSSKLTFGRLAAYGKTGMVATELNLEGGRLEAGASKQVGPAGGFRVVTPVAVAGLRGTAFRLNVGEDGQSLRNEVLEGAVGVAAQSQEVLVAKGQGTVAEAGKVPQPPRPLLPAPSASDLPTRVVALPLAFAWTTQDGAKRWRAQVAADTDFQKIYLDALTDSPAIKWDTSLPDGRYVLRLRAIDAAGLEGFNRDHPFELDARPLPPMAATPADGERSRSESIRFEWAAAEGAQGYLLEIATTPDFSAATLIERRLDAIQRHDERLPPGLYYWRLASLDEQKQAHGWSPPRALRLQPPPPAPKPEVRTDNGSAGHFAWAAVAGATAYDLEVDKGRNFAAPEIRRHLTDTQVKLNLKPGRYYWRLRSVETDGQAGDWSKIGQLVIPPESPSEVKVHQTEDALELSWKGSAPAYRLEFAQDAQFKKPLFRHKEESNSSRLIWPQPGQYWVRIIALGENGEVGGKSPAVGFHVQPWKW